MLVSRWILTTLWLVRRLQFPETTTARLTMQSIISNVINVEWYATKDGTIYEWHTSN